MESQIWCPPAGSLALLAEGLEKEQWTLPALLFVRKLPSVLAVMLGSSVPPHKSLMPFNLQPLWWSSEGVSLSQSLSAGHLRGTGWDYSSFCLPGPQPEPWLVFTARGYGHLSFLALVLWAGGPGVGLGPINIYHLWMWDQHPLCLCFSYLFRCGFEFGKVSICAACHYQRP